MRRPRCFKKHVDLQLQLFEQDAHENCTKTQPLQQGINPWEILKGGGYCTVIPLLHIFP
jgi:hypothetical protein